MDGVNTTGVEFGIQGKELNFEFIQEVEFKSGGYEAEYGRATGGILNVVTKSGGNEFHGDVFGYFNRDSLQATNKHTRARAGRIPTGFTQGGLRRSTSAASSSRTDSGSSVRTTASTTRRTRSHDRRRVAGTTTNVRRRATSTPAS